MRHFQPEKGRKGGGFDRRKVTLRHVHPAIGKTKGKATMWFMAAIGIRLPEPVVVTGRIAQAAG